MISAKSRSRAAQLPMMHAATSCPEIIILFDGGRAG